MNDKLLPVEIENVLVNGDLGKLSAEQRLSYYNVMCKSLGLNPLTKPFEYIVLKNKLTLYAKKDATEQLRKLHGVSITNVTTQSNNQCFIASATAVDKSGRVDTDSGVVTITGLKGDELANSIMRAITKAKRRATLSICGLGILDESELDTVDFVQAQATDVSASNIMLDAPPAEKEEVEKEEHLYCFDELEPTQFEWVEANILAPAQSKKDTATGYWILHEKLKQKKFDKFYRGTKEDLFEKIYKGGKNETVAN